MDDVIYDAVCAVVINADELTHDADIAVVGTNPTLLAVNELIAQEAVSALDAEILDDAHDAEEA